MSTSCTISNEFSSDGDIDNIAIKQGVVDVIYPNRILIWVPFVIFPLYSFQQSQLYHNRDKSKANYHLNEIKLGANEYCYHAGTAVIDNKTYAIGGRVLSFVCLSESFSSARTQIIDSIKSLNWNDGFYRKDIGYKVIDEWE